MGMTARCFTRLVGLAALLFALPAVAAEELVVPAPSGRVQVLQSRAASPRARRCLTRIREELVAGRFEVVMSEFGAESDALWTVDQPSARDSLATITLVGEPDEGAAELWIFEGGPSGRAAIRRFVLPAGAGAHDEEVLAVRTLEFLRASALELARSPTPTPVAVPSPPPAPVVATIAPAPSPSASPPKGPAASGRLSFELGLCLLESSRALGPAYVPLVRLRAELLSHLEARLSVAAFGTRPRVTAMNGSAAVEQDFGLLELRATFRRGHRIRPSLGVGGGAGLVRVAGAGNWPYGGLRSQQWASLFDAGGGVTISLWHRLALAVEAHVQAAAPYSTILVSGEEAARLGRPTFLTALTLVTPL